GDLIDRPPELGKPEGGPAQRDGPREGHRASWRSGDGVPRRSWRAAGSIGLPGKVAAISFLFHGPSSPYPEGWHRADPVHLGAARWECRAVVHPAQWPGEP